MDWGISLLELGEAMDQAMNKSSGVLDTDEFTDLWWVLMGYNQQLLYCTD